MNRKLFLGVFFVLAIFTSATFINFVSAGQAGNNSLSNKNENFQSRISTTIVISQVYGGGGGSTGTYLNDYVELFNISGNPQSLNGLALQYGSAAGNFGSTATNIFALPDVTLQPGQHYLVQLGPTGAAGAAFPVAPDATTSGINAAAGSAKIALTNTATGLNCGATATPCTLPDLRIVDEVSYGASNNGEGGTTVNNGSALTSTQAAVRNNNGCADTDNNNNDFTVVTAPVPRNQASAATPCGGGGGTPTPTPRDANVDFNGDNKTDYVVTRTVSGGKVWYSSINGTGAFTGVQFGLGTDIEVPEDFDGDNKDDIAVYRAGAQSAFYILQSQTNTFRGVTFGTTGDDPKIIADYDGDNKADVAFYRKSSSLNYFIYISSINGNVVTTQWGSGTSLRPVVGDYDGDNKADFCVYTGTDFYLLKATGGQEYIHFGAPGDAPVPGDFDGDGKADFTVLRNQSGQFYWYTLTRNNVFLGASFGLATDIPAPGDYDGDGKTDIAVWRPGANAGETAFYSRKSIDGTLQGFQFGINTDYPAANWYVR